MSLLSDLEAWTSSWGPADWLAFGFITTWVVGVVLRGLAWLLGLIGLAGERAYQLGRVRTDNDEDRP